MKLLRSFALRKCNASFDSGWRGTWVWCTFLCTRAEELHLSGSFCVDISGKRFLFFLKGWTLGIWQKRPKNFCGTGRFTPPISSFALHMGQVHGFPCLILMLKLNKKVGRWSCILPNFEFSRIFFLFNGYIHLCVDLFRYLDSHVILRIYEKRSVIGRSHIHRIYRNDHCDRSTIHS